MTRAMGRKRYRAFAANPLYTAISRGLTFTWFAFTLLWFWSNWPQIGALTRAMGTTATIAALFSIFVCATFLLSLWEAVRLRALSLRIGATRVADWRYLRVVACTAAANVAVATVILANAPAPDLIYKAF